MKIAFVMPHLNYAIGGVRRIVEISNRLLKLGHKTFIYHPGGKPCRWIQNKVPTIKLEKLSNQKFDIVLFNLAEQYRYALNSDARAKVFWVLAPEAIYKDPRKPLEALQHNFFFLANSKFTAEYIKQYRRVKYNIPVISGAINPDHFYYNADIKKDFHVIYSGSPRPWKGSELIRRALNSPKLKILKMHAQKRNQKDLGQLFNQATCFVSACQAEGFNFMPLEAMACGCPIVTTDDGGNRDYVTTENAITVARNVQAIRQGVHLVLKDKNLRRNLKREGLKTARDPKYDWNNVTKKLESVLKGILKNGTIKNI